MSRAFTPRRSKNEVPCGWTHVPAPSPKDRHTYYRCPEIGSAITIDGSLEWRRCTYVCRKNQIRDHPSRKHPHNYSRPRDRDPGFPAAFEAKQEEKQKDDLRQAVIDHNGVLALKLGLTLSQASNDSLVDFVIQSIQMGSEFGSRVRHVNLHDVIGKISPYHIRQSMAQAGQQLKEQDMIRAREVMFVNIACDSGTVLGNTVVHALLTNPYHSSFPMVLRLSPNDHFTHEDYYLLFNTLCEECCANKLVVCGIIIDNLRAQVNGLHLMLQNFADDSYKASIVHVPCFAHMTNLVFVHSMKKSHELARIVNGIQALVRCLRKPAARRELNETCPAICKTRWLYVVDILLWCFARKDKLNAFLTASENNYTHFTNFPAEWGVCLEILKPLKYFTYAVESSECALWEVKILVDNVIEAWRNLSGHIPEQSKRMFGIFVREFVLLLKRNAYKDVITSYSLTECGREELRHKEEGFQTENDTNASPPFCTPRMKMSEFWMSIENTLALERELESSFEEEEDSSGSVDIEDLVQEEEEEEEAGDVEFDKETPQDVATSCDALCSTPVYDLSFEIAFSQLKLMGHKQGLTEDYVYEIFRNWIFRDRCDSPTNMERHCSPDVIWRRAPSHDERWRDFSMIALRYVTLGASEADCERSLSKQKDCQGLHTTKIGSDLLDWRIRAMHSQTK